MAKHVGCTAGAVARAIERFGWETERRNPSRIEFDEYELRCEVPLLGVTAYAQKKGCSTPVVRKALREFGIPLPSKQRPKRDLTREYLTECREKGWTVRGISEDSGHAYRVVVKALDKLGMPRRKKTRKYPLLPRELLVLLYEKQLQSTTQIGKAYGIPAGVVAGQLHDHGISLRSKVEGLHTRYPKGRRGSSAANWRGGVMKREYIILHREIVEQRWPNHPRLALPDWTRCQEHILVWENMAGQLLPPGWEIDHLDGNKHNNAEDNLEPRESRGAHQKAEWRRGKDALVENAALRARIEELKRGIA